MSRQRMDDPELQSEKEVALGFDLQRLSPDFSIGRLVRRFLNIRPAGPVVRGGRARFRGLAQFPVSV
jgi:hypothetical protein